MKKIKSVLLGLLVIILCGCSTISTNMEVSKDKSMNITYLITLDKEYLGNKTFNELFSSKNINCLRNNGYTVTDYEDEDNFGYKVSASIKDIDTISQTDNIKINLYDLLYSDIQNEAIHVSSLKEINNKELLKKDDNTYLGIITLEDIENGEKHNIRTTLVWEDIENNSKDYELGSIYDNELKIKVSIKFSQYLNDDMKV